jgi:hypothetical protein
LIPFAFSDFFDFFETVKPAVVDAVASSGCLVPAILAGQITRPEGPSPALIGPDRINPAPFFAFDSFEKDAVFSVFIFDYTESHTNPFEIFPAKLTGGDF